MAGNDDEDFAAMFAEFEQDQKAAGGARKRRPKVGDAVRGKVISIGKDAVFVDLGGKAEGVLDRDQVIDKDDKLRVSIGDEVEARVVDDRGGALVLKIKMGGRGVEARAELVTAAELGMPVDGLVTEVVKGGLSVEVAGMRAFCPASQVDVRFVDDLAPLVGQRLTFKITRYEPGPRGNLVLSRRAVLEESRAAHAEEMLGKIVPGAVIRGEIISIKPYGAFVDLGGLEGMLHVSQLGYSRIEHPEEVLKIGQQVDVMVLDLKPSDDPKKPMRISLSLKALAADPWLDAAAGLVEGATMNGTITRLTDFGAFVEIAPGVEGLVHISELGAGRRINHPKEVVKVGETVEVTILGMDHEKHRVALSIGAKGRAEEAAAAEHGRTMQEAAPAKLGTFGDLLAKAAQKATKDKK